MKINKKLIFYLFFAIVFFVFSIGAFYYLVILPSRILIDASETIVKGFAETFNFTPRITTENTVIIEEQAAILEVAVYSQRLVHDSEYTNTWLGSTKELHLRGIYLAKYGFNLKNQDFSINISKDDSMSGSSYILSFVMPEPILLSFEMENYRIIQDKDGWWNKINKTEREIAVNLLRGTAKEKALSQDYRNKVKESIESQLKIMMAELQLEIQIEQINFIWQDNGVQDIQVQDERIKSF